MSNEVNFGLDAPEGFRGGGERRDVEKSRSGRRARACAHKFLRPALNHCLFPYRATRHPEHL